ncbi:MAG: hypothetical protein ACLPYS_02760 [Vulcanimicrobiaceae bacterium]
MVARTSGPSLRSRFHERSRLFEVQKYLSIANHMWSGFRLIGNNDARNRLPPDLQAIATAGFTKLVQLQRVDVEKDNSSLAVNLKSQGMTVNKADPSSFRAKLGPFYGRWKSEYGSAAWDLLEKYTGKLA